MRGSGKLIIAAGLMVMLGGCASRTSTTSSKTTADTPSYYEDLSKLRPSPASNTSTQTDTAAETLEIPAPEHHIKSILNAQLDSLTAYTRENLKYINGYSIQVYTGNSQQKAKEALNEMYRLYGEFRPYSDFDPPVYKVKMGRFTERIDVQRVYAKVREIYPNAIIIPERIEIN